MALTSFCNGSDVTMCEDSLMVLGTAPATDRMKGFVTSLATDLLQRFYDGSGAGI